MPRVSYPTPRSSRPPSRPGSVNSFVPIVGRIAEQVIPQVVRNVFPNRTVSEAPFSTTNRYNQIRSVKVKKRKKFSKSQKKFYKKVKRIVEGDDATQHMLRNPHIATGLSLTSALNQQGTWCLSCASFSGTAGTDDDVSKMFTQTFAAAIDEESFLQLKSGRIAYQLVNPSGNTTMDIDIYDMICVKDLPISMASGDPVGFFNDCIAEQGTTGVGGTQLASTTPGVNPYTAGGTYGKYFKIKSHKKLFIPPGDSQDGSFSMKYNKRINGKEVVGAGALLAKRGVSRHLMFVVNGIDWSATTAFPLKLYATKKYCYQSSNIKTHGAGLV